jgi:hypothetical protein
MHVVCIECPLYIRATYQACIVGDSLLYVGRLDSRFLAPGLGKCGMLDFDAFPAILLKEVLQQEAHRYVERIIPRAGVRNHLIEKLACSFELSFNISRVVRALHMPQNTAR